MIRRYVQSSDKDIQALLGVNKNHNDWNQPNLSVCVHAFIGKFDDGSVGVVQTLPWNHRGWHAGTGTTGRSANDTHISFEICEDGLSDLDYFMKTYDAAAELVAQLCIVYGLNPLDDGVVICHQDGYRIGIASNHGDIYNWWPRFGYSMDDFREDVVKKINVLTGDDMVYYKYFEDIPSYYRDAVQKAMDADALKGTGDGELNISEDICRMLTVLDRWGKLD